jgi:hypothetical protein
VHRVVRWVVVVASVLLLPALASAQATITGVVKDASGAVLPGVTIETSSPVLIEKTRTAVTDGTGLINSNAVLTYNQTFAPGGAWLIPQSVLTPRFVKLSAQIDF